MEEIKRKGFNMALADSTPDVLDLREVHDFSKIKVGIQQLADATIDVGSYKKINQKCGDKERVLKAINQCNLADLREISLFFYKTSGIYNRLCRYMAYLYRYDWFITPYINNGVDVANREEEETLTSAQRDKIINSFFGLLKFLDEFELKRFFGEVALKVMKFGCYYGYLVPGNNSTVAVQELPPQYCRSRFSVNGRPVVEFNMSFFDTMYPDSEMRARVLNLFPAEFKKGYKAFKDGKLKPSFQGDTSGWYLLDTRCAIKFNLNGEDFPPFISVIPAIIDLDEAQDLDRRRMAQKLLRIIIQKMPIDKNGDLVFDIDEAQALHNNAVRMLGRAIGIDVLTTFADVDVADMSDKSNTTQTDDLVRVERQIYNEAGVSQMQFNSDSNTALNNSILNDEAALYNLIQQFESFMNLLIDPYNKSPKKCYYKAQILTTTIYNYKEMAKLYKEQTQMGYAKILPQIALGQSQSSILANAYWENDVLDLVSVFVPPLTSNTMNADALAMRNGNKHGSGNKSSGAESDTQEGAGRPEKEDNEKSDKTIANRESM
jgi:hypothetical protein